MFGLSEKLKSSQQQKSKQDSNNNSGVSKAKLHASIRDRLLLKEVADLSSPTTLPPGCKLNWPDPDSLHDMQLSISPDEGYWTGGVFNFHLFVTEEYNMAPPTVRCSTKLWHPNINEEGSVCLSLLRQSPFDELGWAPTRRIKDVVWGLYSLFTDLLNFDEPLNSEAADQFKKDPDAFEKKVKSYMREYCQQSSSAGSKKK